MQYQTVISCKILWLLPETFFNLVSILLHKQGSLLKFSSYVVVWWWWWFWGTLSNV